MGNGADEFVHVHLCVVCMFVYCVCVCLCIVRLGVSECYIEGVRIGERDRVRG